jgi:FtsH-binding integral membrane protein
VIIFAPLVMIFAFVWAQERLDKNGLILFLHAFAALMGLSMSTIFVVFTSASIFSAFMGAAILFAVMSGWGYFTKRNLDGVGQFMFIGLIAIIIASIVNIFIGSTVMATVISALAIIIFLGLTAYDTQKIREIISTGGDTGREEVIGALTLYLDFINLFMNLLQLIGVKRD